MADYSKVEVYLKEKGRMTKDCTIDCEECGFSHYNNESKEDCWSFEYKHPNKAIEIVQKWSNEHPEKTILQDFLEKFPNVRLHKNDGTPMRVCPDGLGYDCSNCKNMTCKECWGRHLSEVSNND